MVILMLQGILLSIRTKRWPVAGKEEVLRSVARIFQVWRPYILLQIMISVTDIIGQ